MTSISSVSGSSAWSSMSTQRAQRHSPERLLQKIDTDQSGGVDSTELQGLLDKVAEKTGTSVSASDTLTQFDTDGDGQLGSEELGTAMQSLMPPPSTMEFAQRRSGEAEGTDGTTGATTRGQAGDDLFGKVDTDSDGTVSQTELQALLETMSGGTASQTGVSSDDLFATLDTDGDGSLTQAEFDAGRPEGGQGGHGEMHGAGGMPPPPPAGAGTAGSATADSSTTYDPLDTNEDGVVSLSERLAGDSSSVQQEAITALFNAIDTDGDQKISDSESSAFIQALTSGMDALSASASSASGTASSSDSSSTSSSDSPRGELLRLAELARQRYEETAAAGLAGSTSSQAVSALA